MLPKSDAVGEALSSFLCPVIVFHRVSLRALLRQQRLPSPKGSPPGFAGGAVTLPPRSLE